MNARRCSSPALISTARVDKSKGMKVEIKKIELTDARRAVGDRNVQVWTILS